MLGLFSVSQVDAVSVLGTINKDKAVVPDDWRAAVEDCRTGRGAISLTGKGQGWSHGAWRMRKRRAGARYRCVRD